MAIGKALRVEGGKYVGAIGQKPKTWTIDTSNVVKAATNVTNTAIEYTITEKCYAEYFLYATNGGAAFKINNVMCDFIYPVGNFRIGTAGVSPLLLPGDVIRIESTTDVSTYTLYGVR